MQDILKQAIQEDTKSAIALLQGLCNYLQKDLTDISSSERSYMLDKIRLEYENAINKIYSLRLNSIFVIDPSQKEFEPWEYDPIQFVNH